MFDFKFQKEVLIPYVNYLKIIFWTAQMMFFTFGVFERALFQYLSTLDVTWYYLYLIISGLILHGTAIPFSDLVNRAWKKCCDKKRITQIRDTTGAASDPESKAGYKYENNESHV